ncbi:MAG: DUF6519 domain-containing protein [Alphaproteobacteria bacterium]
MKGDFSAWRFDPRDDHQAVLYQQGRLITDADLTEAEGIALAWRLTAGRDVVGAGIAAVPAEDPEGYQVLGAAVDGDTVLVTLHPGRLWADGLHIRLNGEPPDTEAPVTRRASYLPPPHNPTGTGTGDIGTGIRDAVVLEVVLEALNGFQVPARLIEPALGGPDTAERVIPRAGLRLLRLGDGEDCNTIGARLLDAPQGRLTVSLDPPTVVPGDCPVVEGGGYSGFEHNLYRIEIAETTAGPVRFKWSQINGGLVGRGTFHGGADPHVAITANRPAILHSGVAEFYLEAVEHDDELGHWRVTYGTPAALNADGELDLTAPPTFGVIPGGGQPVFFRLWNGIREVADFTDSVNPVELRDGIRLVFDPPAGAAYRPGAWWNFEVRAGEIANPEVLVDDAPPKGPSVRRVPLAEIAWTDDQDTALGGGIEDCRRRFRPLTNQKVCCTYLVGNGTTCFGDFNSLEEAAAHLPSAGGKLCLLPGTHFANLSLVERSGVQIEGCRHRTFVLARPESFDQPIVSVRGGQDISVSDLDLIAPFGIAIDLSGNSPAPLREVRVEECRILAQTHGIRVETASDVRLLGNQIWLLDHPLGVSVISIRATDALIEKNRGGVWPFEYTPPGGDDPDGEEPPDPSDPCIEPEQLFANLTAVIAYVTFVWSEGFAATPPEQPYRARGGIHVKGGSTRIDIRRNRIDGGLGHGITLGGVFPEPGGEDREEEEEEQPRLNPTVRVAADAFFGRFRNAGEEPQAGVTVTLTRSGSGAITYTGITDENGEVRIAAEPGSYILGVQPGLVILDVASFVFGAAIAYVVTVGPGVDVEDDPDQGFLTRIRIVENEIESMGLSGIGFWFYDLVPDPPEPQGQGVEAIAELLSAMLAPAELIGTANLVRDLEIRGNRIENNLRAEFTDLLRRTALFAAQGGISLALVEGLKIEQNHIAGNGRSAAQPCAGIFVGYGEEVLITGNHITGNGPADARYRELRSDGLRGGIFIRLASAVVAGATADGQQKPALIIADNVVDQPAGRAITAFAYGPVSCVGNTLNAEREGAWGAIDTLVGGVLILNLGGVHRMQAVGGAESFVALGDLQGPAPATGIGLTAASRLEQRVEAMLPGGETLFNSNRVRTGPDNRCWSSQLIATLDDLGYADNQSGMFRPDIAFGNMIGVAHSLRATGNRFRERALRTGLSALTITAGTTVGGGAGAMNITTHNQGDHCIIALSQGVLPVADTPNQVVHNQLCPGAGRDVSAGDYTRAALLLPLRGTVSPDVRLDQGGTVVRATLNRSISGLERVQARSNIEYAREAVSYEAALGRDTPLVAELRDAATVRRRSAAALGVQAEIAQIREAEPPSDGVLLHGRVAGGTGRGASGQVVELVDAGGRPLGFSARTDSLGYYTLALDEETRAALARREGVFLRVTSESGEVTSREPQRLRLEGDPLVRRDFEIAARLPILPMRPADIAPVFRRDAPVRQPPRSPARGPDITRPEVRIQVENIRGVGSALAARLREAGIEDAEALSRLSDERAIELLGGAGRRLRDAARAALEAARRENGGETR